MNGIGGLIIGVENECSSRHSDLVCYICLDEYDVYSGLVLVLAGT